MKKKESISYFAIVVILFILLNLPLSFVGSLKRNFLFTSKLFAAKKNENSLDRMHLQLENETLKKQLEMVRYWIFSQDQIEEHAQKIEEILGERSFTPYHQRRVDDLKNILALEAYSTSAKVIFRDPAFWSSGFWVNKGEKENRKLGRTVIGKNSPVILGLSLVGVVEEVEEGRSYVRLITDSSLTPAVRAVRGSLQNESLLFEIDHLQGMLQCREDIEEASQAMRALRKVKEALYERDPKTSFLVKGELKGSSYPLWRSRSMVLQGIGFNYEYEDEEGPSREIHRKSEEKLLQRGDLLITSGLDGIFPKGLDVAVVSKIHPLKEGSFAYELEARSVISNLGELEWVEIIPPLSDAR